MAGIVFEISTKNYSDNSFLIKKALSQLEALTGHYNGYMFGESSSKLGWTFFKMSLKPELENAIREKFSDMIGKYRGGDQNEKFTKFMNDYLQAKGCEIKLKIIS